MMFSGSQVASSARVPNQHLPDPATKAKQTQRRPTSFPAPVTLDFQVISPFSSLPSPSPSHTPCQMSDSYASSDYPTNGYANGSSPSLAPTGNTSSITRKKLMGYVGFANLPNQVHRKSVRKGFQFTTMVVGMLSIPQLIPLLTIIAGESGLGKSTLINTLFNTTLYPPKEPLAPAAERPKTVAIESIGAGMLFLQRGSRAMIQIIHYVQISKKMVFDFI